VTISKRAAWLLAILLSFSLVAAACGDDDDADAGDSTTTAAPDDGGDSGDGGDAGDGAGDVTGFVNISGSSTVEPISARVAELYEDVEPGVEVTVNGPGTSAGFREFCPGNTDINDASRQIKDSEIAEGNDGGPCVDNVELRVAFDGIAIMVNPSNPLECVSFADLYALSGPESEGNTWEDAGTFATELGSTTTGFPSGEVEVIAPGTESGTYGSYIEIVLEGLSEERAEAGDYTPQVDENGDDILIRTDYAGQPDDNVIIDGIAGTDTAFGWVGFAFAAQAGDAVKVLDVLNEETGECVAPSLESIADGSYPVSRSLYIYVNTAKAAESEALVSYVDFYLNGAYPDAVVNAFDDGVGYVALPDDLLAETRAAWDAVTG
jgi:phosphate transport system substrate-binding protein